MRVLYIIEVNGHRFFNGPQINNAELLTYLAVNTLYIILLLYIYVLAVSNRNVCVHLAKFACCDYNNRKPLSDKCGMDISYVHILVFYTYFK